jgi:hypothetical protein
MTDFASMSTPMKQAVCSLAGPIAGGRFCQWQNVERHEAGHAAVGYLLCLKLI